MSTKLLLLDESLLVQRVVELAFRDKGVDVLIAENADEALKMAENTPPDLVVAGLDLKHSDGLDFCRRLRDKPQFAHFPLLVLTSTRNSVSDEEIKALGAVANIEKPFKPIVFTTEVERIIAPSESAPRPECEEQAESDSPSAMAAGKTAATEADETKRAPAAAEDPLALNGEALAPIIQKHLEDAAEKIVPTLLHHIEEIVAQRLPDIVEKIVIREIEKIKRGE